MLLVAVKVITLLCPAGIYILVALLVWGLSFHNLSPAPVLSAHFHHGCYVGEGQ